MVGDQSQPLSSQELAEIDAQYRPFPSFQDWPQAVPSEELWQSDHDLFVAVSEKASKSALREAQEIALRTAAFDTGAIEGLYSTDRGLTFTVATQAAAWEQKVSERDAGALELFKAQLAAFELILDLATERFPQITQAWLRRLHEELTAAQDTYVVYTPIGPQRQPLPKAKYKKYPNHVRTADGEVHAYAPVEKTQSEMQRLVDELATPAFREAHPILQAAYAHYAIAVVHPFADGNGRVARAAASAYTYRAASVPLLVQAHDRDRYLAALARADKGDFGPFIEFTAKAARDALEIMTASLETAQAPQPDVLLSEFRELFLGQGELSHQQLDEVAEEFLHSLHDIVSSRLKSLSVPDGVDIRWVAGMGSNHGQPPDGFRKIVKPGPRFIALELEAAAPASASITLKLDIFVSTGPDPATTLLVLDARSKKSLRLSLSDLQPALSSSARFRIESYVQQVVAFGLEWLLKKSKRQLQRNGY